MKRKLTLTVAMLFMILLTVGTVFGSSSVSVTQEQIYSAVQVSKQFPISVQIDGKEIKTETPAIILAGKTLIPARAVIEAMGGSVEWNDQTSTVTVKRGTSSVILTIHSDVALVDGIAQNLDVPALIVDGDGDGIGSTMIPLRFVSESLGCIIGWDQDKRMATIVSSKEKPNNVTATTTETAITNEGLPTLNATLTGKVIVIDAGHGGVDPGSLGQINGKTVLQEKDVNLDVALKLNTYLKAAGASTYLLRDSDMSIGLQERPIRANEANGFLFVSIHNNSSESPQVSGTEVYYYSKAEESTYGIDSKTIAQAVQTAMVKNLGLRDRGIKSEPAYAVLNKTKMPAIIIEGAFLSNGQELQYMLSESFSQKYAYSAAKAILDILNVSVK